MQRASFAIRNVALPAAAARSASSACFVVVTPRMRRGYHGFGVMGPTLPYRLASSFVILCLCGVHAGRMRVEHGVAHTPSHAAAAATVNVGQTQRLPMRQQQWLEISHAATSPAAREVSVRAKAPSVPRGAPLYVQHGSRGITTRGSRVCFTEQHSCGGASHRSGDATGLAPTLGDHHRRARVATYTGQGSCNE